MGQGRTVTGQRMATALSRRKPAWMVGPAGVRTGGTAIYLKVKYFLRGGMEVVSRKNASAMKQGGLLSQLSQPASQESRR